MAINVLATVQALQETLSHAAKQSLDRRFGALFDKVYRDDVLWQAWFQVRRNGGGPGIDNETLVAVVGATFAYAAGRSVAIMLAMRNHGSMIFRAGANMRRNLLERIYEMPGADALDDTPGEVVSRFRDDVDHTLEPFDMSVDIFGANFAALLRR